MNLYITIKRAYQNFANQKLVILRQVIIFLVCSFVTVRLLAQQKGIDSLKNIINTTTDNTIRVDGLVELAYYHIKDDSGLFYANKAEELAKKIDYLKGEAASLRAHCSIYFSHGDYISGIPFAQKSLEICTPINDEMGILHSLELLADLYYFQKDYRQELEIHLKAEKIARKLKLKDWPVMIMGNIGKTYDELNIFDSAEMYFVNAMNIINQTKIDSVYIAPIFEFMGSEKLRTGKLVEARNLENQALTMFNRLGDKYRAAEVCVDLSKLFIKANKTDSAQYYAEMALQLVKEDADSTDIIMESGNQLALIYESKNNYKEALRYYKISMRARDSSINYERANKLSGYSFQIKQKEREIIESKKQYQAKLLLYLSLTGLFTFILIALFLLYSNRQKQKAKSNIQKAYHELQSVQRQLIQSEKMASLGEITAGIAHEIQNPLNFVNNFSEVNIELIQELKNEILSGNKEEVISIANDIVNNEEKIAHHGKKADAIVKGMLQHSQASSGKSELTDINVLTNEYLRLSYHGFRAKDKSFDATMQTDFDSNIGKINIVPQDIGRVLLNLYNNAFYAVVEKKKQQSENYEPSVSVSTKKIKGKVQIRVRDNGNGIPQKVIDKIFQPFFTTKPPGQGTGLGLSLSYDIIKAFGGEISVDTREGEFTEFVAQIPVV